MKKLNILFFIFITKNIFPFNFNEIFSNKTLIDHTDSIMSKIGKYKGPSNQDLNNNEYWLNIVKDYRKNTILSDKEANQLAEILCYRYLQNDLNYFYENKQPSKAVLRKVFSYGLDYQKFNKSDYNDYKKYYINKTEDKKRYEKDINEIESDYHKKYYSMEIYQNITHAASLPISIYLTQGLKSIFNFTKIYASVPFIFFMINTNSLINRFYVEKGHKLYNQEKSEKSELTHQYFQRTPLYNEIMGNQTNKPY